MNIMYVHPFEQLETKKGLLILTLKQEINNSLKSCQRACFPENQPE